MQNADRIQELLELAQCMRSADELAGYVADAPEHERLRRRFQSQLVALLREAESLLPAADAAAAVRE